jgi:predicted GNAT family N-acyltransferase
MMQRIYHGSENIIEKPVYGFGKEYNDFNMKTEIYKGISAPAVSVREKVFVEEQGFKNEFDDIDNIAVHIVMFDDNNEPIATCRIFDGEDPKGCILGRLAVIKEYRKNNIGRTMLEEAEKYARSVGKETISLHAQCRVKEFYRKSGFTEYGEIDYDEGCPHIWMKKSV